jgi:hypothetical protein
VLEAGSVVEVFDSGNSGEKKIMEKKMDFEATSIGVSANGVVAIGSQVIISLSSTFICTI